MTTKSYADNAADLTALDVKGQQYNPVNVNAPDRIGEINFGQQSNGAVDYTGRLHGVGEWSPSKRAAVYKRGQKQNTLNHDQKNYLRLWEFVYGEVKLGNYEARYRAKDEKTGKDRDYQHSCVYCMNDPLKDPGQWGHLHQTSAQRASYEQIMRELGPRAAREGFIRALHFWAKENRRMPRESEIYDLIKSTERAIGAAKKIYHDNPFKAQLESLWGGMQELETELLKKYGGNNACNQSCV